MIFGALASVGISLGGRSQRGGEAFEMRLPDYARFRFRSGQERASRARKEMRMLRDDHLESDRDKVSDTPAPFGS